METQKRTKITHTPRRLLSSDTSWCKPLRTDMDRAGIIITIIIVVVVVIIIIIESVSEPAQAEDSPRVP